MRRTALAAFIAYQALAVAMTWPLVAGLTGDVPGDLGDSLLNLWILAWGAEQLPRLLVGQISLHDFWNANIFHPEPLSLSFSETLVAQAVQILPVYHLTGNVILSYNLLVLTSFSLSGLGMFLVVRDLLEGSGVDARHVVAAAFVAGLVYAFVPFRIAQIAHIQSLSSQWMPFALWGLRRFLLSRHTRWLVAGSGALLLQNWSCGYYLMFFAPFVLVFVLHQLWVSGAWRDRKVWAGLTAAAVVVALGTWPVLALYLEAQRVYGFERPLAEVLAYSADVRSYATAPEALRLWGPLLQVFPKPEGELFFGLIPITLAVLGLVLGHRRGPNAIESTWPFWRRATVGLLGVLVLVGGVGLAMIVATGGVATSILGVSISASNGTRLLMQAGLALAVLLALSPRARERLLAWVRSPAGIASVLCVLAVWMSLGPRPASGGRALELPALYRTFYDYVPGFDGLRVPARYAMVAAVFLSMLAGVGGAAILRSTASWRAVAALLSVVFLVEAAFAPMPVNVTWGGKHALPPPRVFPPRDAPPAYHHINTMSDVGALAEFPFGDEAWELRYVYYSTVHWKRLVNGYSGGFPPGYKRRVAALERIAERPEEAWTALRDSGATHALVHERALSGEQLTTTTAWLEAHFAVEIARFPDGARLYDLVGAWKTP